MSRDARVGMPIYQLLVRFRGTPSTGNPDNDTETTHLTALKSAEYI
jgi:hypothetical protein